LKLTPKQHASIVLSWYDLIQETENWRLFVDDRCDIEFHKLRNNPAFGERLLHYREIGKEKHPDDFNATIRIFLTNKTSRNLATLLHEAAHVIFDFFYIYAKKEPTKEDHPFMWRVFYAKLVAEITGCNLFKITKLFLRCKKTSFIDLEVERLLSGEKI